METWNPWNKSQIFKFFFFFFRIIIIFQENQFLILFQKCINVLFFFNINEIRPRKGTFSSLVWIWNWIWNLFKDTWNNNNPIFDIYCSSEYSCPLSLRSSLISIFGGAFSFQCRLSRLYHGGYLGFVRSSIYF